MKDSGFPAVIICSTAMRAARLVVTDEFLKVYFARPELMPPKDACAAERRLHRELLADPRRPVALTRLPRSPMTDARENWQFVVAFRDLLLLHPTLEAAYLALVRSGSITLPPLFVNQLVHVILRNALERLRGSIRASRCRVVLPAAADHAA